MDLPPILRFDNGKPVDNPERWSSRRRELLNAFANQYYGIAPAMPKLEILNDDGGVPASADGQPIIRRQLRIGIDHPDVRHPGIQVLLQLPADTSEPVPLFVGLNFHGNHAYSADPAVALPLMPPPTDLLGWGACVWGPERRGESVRRLPAGLICARGYAVATAFCGDIAPDHPLFFSNGLAGKIAPGRDASWRAIGRWAWGLSALRIALSDLPTIDGDRCACFGHSRLGKASLWAGAQDSAFGLVISNDSGCCGAALNRRAQGETIKAIVSRFPHWFVPSLPAWFERDAELPYDAHQLIACVAPRMCHVGSATQDGWADPEGEFLALRHAGEAWTALGKTPLEASSAWPESDTTLRADTAYHLREGGHDIVSWDWEQYLDSADQVFGR